ncbi:nucleotide modification associated domain-containing protein [Lactobacillus hamsteri]|uniref:nucleotide modification associated domain-containing protein n=1 Tax=Lactobacillus hamsteri TaxID=96565 RepID=UPI000469A60A|nr:nucleotide modification associated domain-containing protein [Lactobacillus hamsteri]
MTIEELEKRLKKIDDRLYIDKSDDETEIMWKDWSTDNFDWNVYYFGHFDSALPDEIKAKKDQISDLVKEYEATNKIQSSNSFKRYTDHLADVLLEKNEAYGDSFTKSVDQFGNTVIAIRLSDKFNRICSLIGKDELKENDESLQDTLLDMAGYSILALST